MTNMDWKSILNLLQLAMERFYRLNHLETSPELRISYIRQQDQGTGMLLSDYVGTSGICHAIESGGLISEVLDQNTHNNTIDNSSSRNCERQI